MNKSFIEKTIDIQAPAGKVWRVFTDPLASRQMGGEYVSDWKTGSSFGWKGSNGNMYTNGIILQIETGRFLQHNLFGPDNKTVISVITYQLSENNTFTSLRAREDLFYGMTDNEYEEASQGWAFALNAVKEIAASL